MHLKRLLFVAIGRRHRGSGWLRSCRKSGASGCRQGWAASLRKTAPWWRRYSRVRVRRIQESGMGLFREVRCGRKVCHYVGLRAGTDAKGIPVGDYTAVVTKFDFPTAVPTDMKAYEEQLRLRQANPACRRNPPVRRAGFHPCMVRHDLQPKVRIEGSGNPNIELKLSN